MKQPAVSLTDVTFAFPPGDTAVLSNLSLDIPDGTVTAVLGPNGAGKTTVLNLILGWLRPASGSVRLFGTSTGSATRREMGRMISLVPQDEHIPFEYTTLDYILLGRTPHLGPLQAPGEADVQVAWTALETVGLEHLAERNVAEMSGGEKQLALIARALVQQPRILLMDEPTAHLDLRNRRRTVDLIHTLHHRGVTVILTTHNPELALAASDHVILLDNGRLLAHGPTGDVMTEANLGRAFGMDLFVRTVSVPDNNRKKRTVVIW